jgi:hypothetical protein
VRPFLSRCPRERQGSPAPLNGSSSIARVTPGGSTEIVASGSPLDWCSSLSFGTSHGFRQRLFGVNFSIGELFDETGGFGPAVFSLDAGVQGMPLPLDRSRGLLDGLVRA